MRAGTIGLVACGAIGLLGGCAHNDVLVFGTGTVFGADVAASPAEGGAPHITLGYKRYEGAWLPLRPVPRPPPPNDDPIKDRYVSEVTYPDGRKQTDAYSVFASIGAKYSGDLSTSPKAGFGIAQFFATGNAAINIANNPSLVTVLKLDSDSAATAQAGAVAAVAASEADKLETFLALKLTADERVLTPEQTEVIRKRDETVAKIITCATDPTTHQPRIFDFVKNMPGLKSSDRDYLARASSPKGLGNRIASESSWLSAATEAMKTMGCGGS